jgi:hypothetical protein
MTLLSVEPFEKTILAMNCTGSTCLSSSKWQMPVMLDLLQHQSIRFLIATSNATITQHFSSLKKRPPIVTMEHVMLICYITCLTQSWVGQSNHLNFPKKPHKCPNFECKYTLRSNLEEPDCKRSDCVLISSQNFVILRPNHPVQQPWCQGS